jgi:hypothetical protein
MPYKNIGGSDCRKQKVSDRHCRGCPERDDETEIDRVPHEFVIEWCAEARRRHWAADEVVGNLMQSKQSVRAYLSASSRIRALSIPWFSAWAYSPLALLASGTTPRAPQSASMLGS